MSQQPRRAKWIVGLAAYVTLFAAAWPARAQIKVIELTPSKVATVGTCDSDHGSPCGFVSACLATMGTAPPESTTTARAGFADRYKSGSGMCPCWEWVSCFVRAFIAFDLAPLHGNPVVAAELRWTNRTQKQLGSVATNEGTCLKSLFVVTGPWAGLQTPGDALQLDLLGPQRVTESIQVGHTVRDWALGRAPNHGFMIAGMKEATTAKSREECMTELQGIRLAVTINQKQAPPEWPAPTASVFKTPTFQGHRVDACRRWAAECGQPAANEFCARMGYSKAVDFEIAKGVSPTVTLVDQKTCSGANCDGFASITCSKDP